MTYDFLRNSIEGSVLVREEPPFVKDFECIIGKKKPMEVHLTLTKIDLKN